MSDPHVLDNPARASLAGPHARFAERDGNVMRYPEDVSPFVGIPDEPDASDWKALAALTGAGSTFALFAVDATPPDGWDVTSFGDGVQLVDDGVEGAPDAEAVPLGPADVPEMLELTARTRPGPFRSRTAELGTYLGIRREGRLVAMAGERLRPPGWTEISAVCTDEAWRGHGFASRLIRALVADMRARGDRPFMHALASNTNAIRLYQAMGFRLRRTVEFTGVRVPPTAP